MSGRTNTHSSTSGQLAELEKRKVDFGLVITRRRKFAVFSSIECTNLENAIVGALSILLEKFHFDTNVTQLTVSGCIIAVAYKDLKQYVLLGYQGPTVSMLLVDASLQQVCRQNLVETMNAATLSVWEPPQLTSYFVAGFLVGVWNNNFEAQIEIDSGPTCETYIKLTNAFVLDVLNRKFPAGASKANLKDAITFVEQSIQQQMDRLKWPLGNLHALSIAGILDVYSGGKPELIIEAEQILSVTAFMSETLEAEGIQKREKKINLEH